jgi:hypothetical protein
MLSRKTITIDTALTHVLRSFSEVGTISLVRNCALIVLLSVAMISHSKSLDFIDDDFEKFVDRIVLDTSAQTPFKAYYTNLSEKLKNGDEQKRKSTYRYLLRLAMANLRATHEDWYNIIEPYVANEEKTNDSALNDQRIKISIFLIRYGAYEEFKSMARAHDLVTVKFSQKTLAPQESWWDGMKSTVKSFFSSASNTVAGWFGYGNQQTV